MLRISLLLLLSVSSPVHAGIWPFSDRCEDIEALIADGEVPSKEDAKYYLSECSGKKLESLGDAAAETADDAADKAIEIWEKLKKRAEE